MVSPGLNALLTVVVIASSASGFAPSSSRNLASSTPRAQWQPGPVSLHPARREGSRMHAQSNEEKLVELADMWKMRETLARKSFKNLALYRLGELDDAAEAAAEAAANPEAASKALEKTKGAVVTSTVAVLLGALLLRVGGRAALMSILGLDFVADSGIGDQIDQVIAFTEGSEGIAVVLFLAAWVVAKTFLLDFISVALALASGVLFGGVIQGAVLSALGATLGSLVGFFLARTTMAAKVEKALAGQPVARALAKVVEEDGFKTVFVLRLAPVLPIPLGGYSYIYGASKLSPWQFAPATFLGGLKPYLLDSYLGVFSKQLLDNPGGDAGGLGLGGGGEKDALLLLGLFTLVLVGSLAQDLAGDTWEKVQKEVKDETALREANPEAYAEASDGSDGFASLLPFNATAVTQGALNLVPEGVREECSEEWRGLKAFADAQWAPSLQEALVQRAADAAEDAAEQGRFADQTANQGASWNQQVLKAEPSATTVAASATSTAPVAAQATNSKAVSATGVAWGARPGQSDGLWVSAQGEVVIAASGAGSVAAAREVLLSSSSSSQAAPLPATEAALLQAPSLQPFGSSSTAPVTAPPAGHTLGSSTDGDEKVDAWTLEERKRMAKWSTEGWGGRPTLSNFLWTFAYLKAVADKWDADVSKEHASEALPTASRRQERKNE